ncbi:hypothetical protein [Nocardia sp. NBC_00511]|uniref:hypothetical protein n=1 Tax=Nocardia sp. NBC_00511 TaxID=2903591 RepID=UPI0030E3952D
MSFDPAGKSVDDILDYGAPGLEYWERFLPLYGKAFGTTPGPGLPELQARYDEQRQLDLDGLDTARAELDKSLADAETQWTAHRGIAHALPSAWTGGTGAEALAVVNAQLRRARDDLDTGRAASGAITAALEPLRRAVLAKAEHTRSLLEQGGGEPRIALGGKTPEDIETLIAAGPNPWLAEVFRPDVDRKLAAFTAICDTTDQAVDSHYRTIVTALNQLPDTPYPHPAAELLPQPDAAVQPNTRTPQSLPPAQSSDPPPGTGHMTYPQSTSRPSPIPQPSFESQPSPAPPSSTAPASTAPEAASTAPAQSDTEPKPDTRTQQQRPTSGQSTDPEVRPSNTFQPPSAGESLSPSLSTVTPQSDQFATALKEAVTQLESGLQQGISTALSKLGTLTSTTSPSAPESPGTPNTESPAVSSTSKAHEPETPPTGSLTSSVPTGKIEFDLAGKHFTLARTPDGTMTLAITDPSGETHTFTLTTDKSGTPTLTPSDSPPTPPSVDGTSPVPTETRVPLDNSHDSQGTQSPSTELPPGPTEPTPVDPAAPKCQPGPTSGQPEPTRCPCPDQPPGPSGITPGNGSSPTGDTPPADDSAHPDLPQPSLDIPDEPTEIPDRTTESTPQPTAGPTPEPAIEPPTLGPNPNPGTPDHSVEIPEGGTPIPESPPTTG